MRFLDEHRRRPASLADHLPWAALVSPGVVLNKDGSFTTAFSFRGPDLESSTEEELMAVRARLNNALKRLGTGWCLHVEARRREAAAYPESDFEMEAAWLVDAERRERFEGAEPAFETDFRLALTWLPPADETRRMERWLFDGLARAGQDWRQSLATFRREANATFDLLADALPEIAPLEDAALLTWLHACVSSDAHPVRPPETPVFLDVWLADAGLTAALRRALAINGSGRCPCGACPRRPGPACSTASALCLSPIAGPPAGSASTRRRPNGKSSSCASAGSPNERVSGPC